MIREHEGHASHFARESLGDSRSGRGISHILVDSRIEDMYMGGCVDNLLVSGAFFTDHHIVAADFAYDMKDIYLQDREPTERSKWGRLVNILLELTSSPDHSNAHGMLLFIQDALVSRCPPRNIKELRRIPIPKPYNDMFSFLTDQVSRKLSHGVEVTGKLGPEIIAYWKNK